LYSSNTAILPDPAQTGHVSYLDFATTTPSHANFMEPFDALVKFHCYAMLGCRLSAV